MSEGLARMGAKTQNWDGLPGGFAGMTASDWAAACAGLGDSATRYGWLKYVHAVSRDDMLACSILPTDRTARAGLRRDMTALNVRAVQVSLLQARKGKWVAKAGQNLIIRLGELALAESIGSRACICCSGTGQKIKDGRLVDCCRCSGNKFSKIPLREKAILLDLSYSTYRRDWQAAYEGIHSHIEGWDSDVQSKMRRLKRKLEVE